MEPCHFEINMIRNRTKYAELSLNTFTHLKIQIYRSFKMFLLLIEEWTRTLK